jgi:O-antigen/teichoic acid export membrane protein
MILMAGTLVAQAIPLAVSPVLTRLFSPGDFGLFALYFSISQILSVFVTARYESAIILPEDDKDAVNVLSLSLSITALVTTVLLIAAFVSRYLAEDILRSSGLFNFVFLVPFTVFSIGLYNTMNLWLNRRKRFTEVSAGKIVRSVMSSGLSIGFGMSVIRSGGLIIADTIGQFIAGCYVSLSARETYRRLASAVSVGKMREMAQRYAHFPKFNVVSGLFEKSAGQIPVILMSSFFGSAVTGFFSLSQRVIAAPGSLVGVSVGDVFRQHASVEFQKNGNCSDTFIKLFRLLLFIAVIPFTLLLIFAPAIFAFVFGAEWRVAGEYAQIMTVMFFLSFVVSPLSNMFIIAEKQNIDLAIQVVLLTLVLISFLAGYRISESPRPAIIMYTVTYSLKYCVEFYLSLRFSRGKR